MAFDIDGTLLDTEKFGLMAWKRILADHLSYSLTEELYIRDFCGNDIHEIAKEMVKWHGAPIDPKMLVEARESYTRILMESEPIGMMHYAREALAYFNDIGMPEILVTSSNRKETEFKLAKTRILGLAGVDKLPIVAREDVTAGNGKPMPDQYLRASQIIVISPGYGLTFEDSLPGVISANEAGLYVYAIPNDLSRSRMDLSRIEGDKSRIHLVKNLEEAVSDAQQRYQFKKVA